MMKKLILFLSLFISYEVFAQETIEDKSELCEILTEMMNKDQLYRKGEILYSVIGEKGKYSKNEIDSVWAMQIALDNGNTEKLIELTETYGWLSDDRLNCNELDVWIIFRHAQKEYFEQIAELIEREHRSNRMNDWHYKLIKNHLNGRPKRK